MSKFLWAWFWSRKCLYLCELAFSKEAGFLQDNMYLRIFALWIFVFVDWACQEVWTLPLLEGIAFTWACVPFLTWTKHFYLRVSTWGSKFTWGYVLFFTLGRRAFSDSLMVFASVRVHVLCERSFGSVRRRKRRRTRDTSARRKQAVKGPGNCAKLTRFLDWTLNKFVCWKLIVQVCINCSKWTRVMSMLAWNHCQEAWPHQCHDGLDEDAARWQQFISGILGVKKTQAAFGVELRARIVTWCWEAVTWRRSDFTWEAFTWGCDFTCWAFTWGCDFTWAWHTLLEHGRLYLSMAHFTWAWQTLLEDGFTWVYFTSVVETLCKYTLHEDAIQLGIVRLVLFSFVVSWSVFDMYLWNLVQKL